jgi:phage gp29-like protein
VPGTDLVPYQAPQPPVLVDSRGRPLRDAIERLTGEIAGPTMTGMRSILSGHPAQGLDPGRLADILRQAEQGDAIAYLELAEEMEEKYPHYQSVLATRKRAVTKLPIAVVAAGDSPEEEGDAQLVRDWLKRPTLRSELRDIMDALGKGYSVTEIIWAFSATSWKPGQLKWRSPTFFEFDRVTGEQLLLKGGEDGQGGLPQPLAPYKFITHFAQAKSGLPIRGGLARTVAWYYLFVNFTIKDWITFLEVYGLPLRVGKYANGTSEGDIRKLAQAVAQIGSDAGCVIPQSMMIEFVKSDGGASNPDMFRAFCQYADDAISKAVLGQTSSADAKSGGLGTGQANLHGEVREDIRDDDAEQLAATLMRDLVVPLVMFNRGPRENYPLIEIGEPDAVDQETALKGIEAAVSYNVPVGESYFREVTRVPTPDPDEKLLQRPATAPLGGADGTDLAAGTPNPSKVASKAPKAAIQDASANPVAASAEHDDREPDAIDRLAEQLIAAMPELGDAMMGKFEELIQDATSMTEIREIIAIAAGDAIMGMDTDRFVEIAAGAGFSAKIAGIVAEPGS